MELGLELERKMRAFAASGWGILMVRGPIEVGPGTDRRGWIRRFWRYEYGMFMPVLMLGSEVDYQLLITALLWGSDGYELRVLEEKHSN